MSAQDADTRVELQQIFAEFLRDADPDLLKQPKFTEDFAAKLADFALVWRANFQSNPQAVEAAQHELEQWISRQVQLNAVNQAHADIDDASEEWQAIQAEREAWNKPGP